MSNMEGNPRVERIAGLVRRFADGQLRKGPIDRLVLCWSLAPLEYAVSTVLPGDDELRARVRKGLDDHEIAIEVWEHVLAMPYELVERLLHAVDLQRGLWDIEEYMSDA